MDGELFEEDPLSDTVANPEGMEHVDLTVVVTQAGHKLLFLQTVEIPLFLEILHQDIALFLDVGEVAEAGVALINIDFADIARPVKNILIKVAVDCTEMR